MKKQTLEKQGSNWYYDRFEAVRVERNRYFILLIITLVGLLASITANLFLSPLKTAVPYLIQVNKNDGETTVLKPMDYQAVQKDQNVTLYFLYKYLQARMNYDYGLRQVQADTVHALSTASVYQTYVNQVNASNPKSPTRLYQNNSSIHTKIRSYSFPYPNIVQIHFYTELVNNNDPSRSPPRQYWLATIKFTYSKTALTMNERININPVGFFVTDFQLTEEISNEVQP